MIKRAEIEMSNVQQKSASLLALSLFFAAAGTLPAVADSASYTRSTTAAWNERTTARARLTYPGHANGAKSGAILAPGKKVSDDLCDLPSSGCESYLAN
jgi:hypothetical protein